MPQLTILRGLPASGKSTWAHNNPDAGVDVNRDTIRALIGATDHSQENAVTHIAATMRASLYERGLNIVSSDTNLRARHVRELVEEAYSHNYTVEIKDFIVPLHELIERDARREAPVGEHVIRELNQKFPVKNWHTLDQIEETIRQRANRSVAQPYTNDPRLPSAILVDIDGTLAHMHDRSPYEVLEAGADTLDEAVAHTVQFYWEVGYRIIVMSGRDGSGQEVLEQWLEANSVNYHDLFMRAEGDMRPDWQVKEELIREHVENTYYIEVCLDDRQQVVDKYRELGLKVYQVEPGNF